MEAGKQNLIVNKKASFEFEFYVLDVYDASHPPDSIAQTPRDLTGCTLAAKAKAKITDTAALFTFTADIPTPAKGHCKLSLTAAQTSAMAWDKGVWDCFITYPSGRVEKILEGSIVLDKSVT